MRSSDEQAARTERRFQRVATACALSVGALGLVVMLAWLLDAEALQLQRMKFNTALCLVLLSTSLGIRVLRPTSRISGWAAAGPLALSGISLIASLSEIDLGIDQLFVDERMVVGLASAPGRMGPNTALCLLLSASSLAFLDARRWAKGISSLVLFIAFVALAGHIFSARALFGVPGHAMLAPHTAAGLVVLSIGILAARPKRSPFAGLADSTRAAALARRALPVLILSPIAVGSLILTGQRAGAFGTELGLAFVVTITATLLAVGAWMYATLQGRAERHSAQRLEDDRFLLDLGENLGADALPASALGQVASRLGAHLEVDRALVATLNAEGTGALVYPDHCPGLPHLAGSWELALAPAELVEKLRVKHRICLGDARGYPLLARAGVGALLAVAVQRRGVWVATVAVGSRKPRAWSERELSLLQRAAEYAWNGFERLRSLEELRESEERSRALIEVSAQIVWTTNAEGEITDPSLSWSEHAGQLPGDQLGWGWLDAIHPDDRARIKGIFAHSADSWTPGTAEYRIRGAEHEWRWMFLRVVPLLKPPGRVRGWVAMSNDITEKRSFDELREVLVQQMKALNDGLEEHVTERTTELSAALKEREVLLKEVHHRVKNNLQVISSMINLRSRKHPDEGTKEVLREIQSKVMAIAFIHEQLYKSSDFARVPFPQYISNLSSNILESAGATGNITLDLQVDPIELPLDKAIPCGLILNELLLNSIKHAFPEGRPGRIRVEFQRLQQGNIRLAVADNGVGLPEGSAPGKGATLGLQLINALSKQLAAVVEVSAQPGASFSLTFAG
jgi:PAS domain S-box-containing protein